MRQMFDINDYHIALDKLGKIIIYLRKSREDLIDGRYASDEETLARHEEQLQQWAEKNLGYRIPAEYIYKEIGSGEKISSRPVFQQVLKKIETDTDIDGVLVVNCSRLSRGDLVDCGNLINILEVTKTLVLTPPKIYNLQNKYDKRFFKDELLRGNDYLEQTKELLSNGRHWSVSQGKYVGSVAPWGYDRVSCAEMKVADKKGFTLRQNENAEYVKTMFEMFAGGIGTHRIASHLKAISAPLINDKPWDHCKVKQILTNITYNGRLTWGKRKKIEKIVDGEVVTYRTLNDDCPIYDGLHTAIIPDELWERAQARLKEPTSHIRRDYEEKNPLSGLVKCAVCGRAMTRHIYKDVTRKRKYALDKAELQRFMNMHKKQLKMSNAELARRLNLKKHHAYEWFGNDPSKFYPADEFVARWEDIKAVLQIEDNRFDKAVTVFEDKQKPPTLVCSGHKCGNISSNLHIVEEKMVDMVKAKFHDYNYFLDNYAEEIIKKIDNAKTATVNIDKQIAMKEKQLKNAKIAYEQGVDSLDEYIERKAELNGEIQELLEKKQSIVDYDEEEKTVNIKKAVPILQNVFESYYTLEAHERNALLKTIMSSVTYLRESRDNAADNIELDICWLV